MKTADLQAGVVCLQICCFHYFCATALYDEAGLNFAKEDTHLKLGDVLVHALALGYFVRLFQDL